MNDMDTVNGYLTEKVRTVGLIGYGVFGKQLATIFTGKSCKVLLCDPPLELVQSEEVFSEITELWGNGMGPSGQHGLSETFLPLSVLVPASDLLCVQVPYAQNGDFPSEDMITNQLIGKMKENARLLNFSDPRVIAPDVHDPRIIQVEK